MSVWSQHPQSGGLGLGGQPPPPFLDLEIMSPLWNSSILGTQVFEDCPGHVKWALMQALAIVSPDSFVAASGTLSYPPPGGVPLSPTRCAAQHGNCKQLPVRPVQGCPQAKKKKKEGL